MKKHGTASAIRILVLGAVCSALPILTFSPPAIAQGATHIPSSPPVDTDTAGGSGDVAAQSVFRISCAETNSAGTGFLHKSGNVITAAHVVKGCSNPILILPDGRADVASVLILDEAFDVAVLKPKDAIQAQALKIAADTDLKIGTLVVTWGFPGGYSGRNPILGVGYLSGLDSVRLPSGDVVAEWVVNAAFNRGNSGGPLIQVGTGDVIGVVSSKLAPLPPSVDLILNLLKNQNSGLTYGLTTSAGQALTVTEGQLIGVVLNELRNQVQLVVGFAVLPFDLRTVLSRNGIDP